MRILGIDPGIATVGFGIVDSGRGTALQMVRYGAILTKQGCLWQRAFFKSIRIWRN